jgi:hypothetical protein
MPDTPRSSFRLRRETLQQIEEIRQAPGSPYSLPIRTRVVELAIARLHQVECSKQSERPLPRRTRTNRRRP